MHALNPTGKNFISIQMHKNTYNLIERARGFDNYFNDKSEIQVFNEICPNSLDNHAYYEFLDSIYAKHTHIDGIFVTNDSVHKLVDYYHEKNLSKDCPLVGFDLIETNIKHLREGRIDMLISQQQELQGYSAVNIIYKDLILKQKIKKELSINIEIYFKENLPDSIKK